MAYRPVAGGARRKVGEKEGNKFLGIGISKFGFILDFGFGIMDFKLSEPVSVVNALNGRIIAP